MPPKLCCCANCRLGEDDFNRANSNPPTGNWHEISGEWEILDNELNCINPGVLATTICHPAIYDKGSYIARFDLIGMSDGSVDHWEIGVGDPNSPNYVVEIDHTFATSTAVLKLWSGNKSSLIHEETYSGVNSDAPGYICYAPGIAIDVGMGRIPELEFCDTTTSSDCFTSGGVDVGGFSFRDGRFDNWTYDLHWLDLKICEKCPCFCEKSETDYACFPDELTLSFVSIGGDSAILNSITLFQSFLSPATPWTEKTAWYSEVQSCGSPVGAQYTVRFLCGQDNLGTLSFGTVDYEFENPSIAQIVFSWDDGEPLPEVGPRFAIKESSTCEPIYLVFPTLKVNSAFPSPTCFDPPCDTDGCYTPYCTDLNDQCYGYAPDIAFTPVLTA
jgi:hypothetical protein